MDGNRRWAVKNGLPAIEGHRYVATNILENLIEHAADLGIKYLTLWAWSTENWSRGKNEVTGIMNILRWGFGKFGDKMHKRGIRILAIGDATKLAPDIQKLIAYYVNKTSSNSRITVIFAVNYGGRDEIIRSIKRLANEIINMHIDQERVRKQINNFTIQQFNNYLDTAGIPDPDLIIRTGGEKRLSGFLLWQCQYSELIFVDWYMPDFTPTRLDQSITEYNRRQRRFGK